MKQIIVFSANQNSKQASLSQHSGSEFVVFDEVTGEYDFNVIAKYPEVYKVNGVQSLIGLLVTDEQFDFIEGLNNSVEILAIDDNNPDSLYVWEGPQSKAKFLSVMGSNFFTGSGVEGTEGYVAPRNKLGVLA